MKPPSIEDLLLFLDVILTGEEFAEYSAEEREAMFRAIRVIVAGALEPKVVIQRGDDGFWVCLKGKTAEGLIHLDSGAAVVRRALEECCTVDCRSKGGDRRVPG